MEKIFHRVNVIFLLTDFTPGGVVTGDTVSQNGPNLIALKISTCFHSVFCAHKRVFGARKVFIMVGQFGAAGSISNCVQILAKALSCLATFPKKTQAFQQKRPKCSHCIQIAFSIFSCHQVIPWKRKYQKIYQSTKMASCSQGFTCLKVNILRVFSKWSCPVFVIVLWSVRQMSPH